MKRDRIKIKFLPLLPPRPKDYCLLCTSCHFERGKDIRMLRKDDEWLCPECGEHKQAPETLPPNICAICGEVNPRFFRVSDEEWKKYIPVSLWEEVLCIKCYLNLIE